MTTLKVKEHNSQTGEIIIRDMTPDEHIEHEKWRVDVETKRAEKEAADLQEVLDRASGEAKLEAVGLTRAEIKAIRKGN